MLNKGKTVRDANQSQLSAIWKRFKKSKSAVFGMILFITIVALAIIARIVFDYDNDVIKMDIPNKLLPPCAEHIFGTDNFGRDVLARVLWGAGISLTIGTVTAFATMVIGGLIGAAAGFFGGKVDTVLMRIMDIFLGLPSLVLAIAIVAALGTGMTNIMISLCITHVPQLSRVIRSSVISTRRREFIEAARACGTSNSRMLFRHVIPNSIGPIIIQTTLLVGKLILLSSSLSFLGVGIELPAPEWGSMMSEGREFLRTAPNLVLTPGAFILATALSLNLFGDGLNDALDPRLK